MAISIEAQQKMFGCTIGALKEAYNQSHGRRIFVMGILSDAQEEMAHGNVEVARQFVNRAKYLMSQVEPQSWPTLLKED